MVFPRSPLAIAGLLLLAAQPAALAQGTPDFERPPINYSQATPRDAVSRLEAAFALDLAARGGSERETLRAVLTAFNVPAQSQVLVFSKTSLQRGRISPNRPRALYFSDTAYIGWVPGGLIEVAAIDPTLGPVFYAFDPREPKRGFARDADCLRCHGGNFVRGIPGVFARSVVPGPTGEPLLRHGTTLVDDETPFEERWGGWYVTGYDGAPDHRGNILVADDADVSTLPTTAQRPQELSEFFDVRDYLAPTSDVVALLVLEHQMTVQNALTRAGLEARKMLAYQHGLQEAFHEPRTDEPAYDSVKSVFASVTQELVDRLLFRRAAPLPGGVNGDAAFRVAFARPGPRTADGRSLRDLQLTGRLFAYRCSYLIYSESFRELPPALKRQVLARLETALADGGPDGRYTYLPEAERHAIRAILRETHPDFAERNAPGS